MSYDYPDQFCHSSVYSRERGLFFQRLPVTAGFSYTWPQSLNYRETRGPRSLPHSAMSSERKSRGNTLGSKCPWPSWPDPWKSIWVTRHPGQQELGWRLDAAASETQHLGRLLCREKGRDATFLKFHKTRGSTQVPGSGDTQN